jgi:hypothetical protein
MAIRQLVPIEITLLGDGSSTTFVFPAQNLYQNGVGGSNPPVANGTVPSAVLVPNPPIAITSAVVDANGNITITFTAAPTNNVQYTFEVDLLFTSGAVTSSSATPVPPTNLYATGTALTATGSSLNVNITGGSSGNAAASATGSAVPASADYQGVNIGGTLRGRTGVNPTGTVYAAQTDITSFNGTALTGTVTAYGTAPTGNVFGVNASVTNMPGGTNTSVIVWNSTNGTNGATQNIITNTILGSVTTTFVPSGSLTGGTVVFDASLDGTNWFSISGLENGGQTNLSSFGLNGLATPFALTFDVRSYPYLRLRLTAAITGTGNVTVQSSTSYIAPPEAFITNASLSVVAQQSGTWTTRIVGNAGGIVDAAQNTTAPANVIQVGGVYNSAAPTITSGDLTALQTDLNGNLKVTGSFSSGALADLVGTPGTLNALNAAATINAFGYTHVGMFLAAGTLIGTIIAECSLDGGTTWVGTYFNDPTTNVIQQTIVFSSSNTATSKSIIGVAGASNYRVRVSAFTSGTATCTLRANEIGDPSTLTSGLIGTASEPPLVSMAGGWTTSAQAAYSNATLNPLSLNTTGQLQVDNNALITSGFVPDPGNYGTTLSSSEAIDAVGNSITRSAVFTDEGSFRDDFSGTSLNTTIGANITTTASSALVTSASPEFGNGNGTAIKIGQYIKISSDPETDWTQLNYIVNTSEGQLVSNYPGTATTAAGQVTNWRTLTGSGGSFAVASSVLTIASGTTASAFTGIIGAQADYLPLLLQTYVEVSQRIANETVVFGFQDTLSSTPNYTAVVSLSGTTNTTGNFITQSSSAATDTQTTAFTYPLGTNSGTYHTYSISLSANQATLLIDGVVVATNTLHIPGPYNAMQVVYYTLNGGTAPVSSTSLLVDYTYFIDTDRVQIDDDYIGEPLVVAAAVQQDNASTTYSQGMPAQLQMDILGNLKIAENGSLDSFGDIIHCIRNSQWQQDFSEGQNTALTQLTGTTGTATYSNGSVTLATTAAASTSANLQSTYGMNYRVSHEWYFYFTAAFTTGVAASHQRIGALTGAVNTPTNGVCVGFEGTTFGISYFKAGTGQGSFSANSAPSVARASFSGDQCTGSSGSKFTQGGTPTALTLTNLNLYRLRGGWLGAASIVLEVFSPDGNWVVMHTIVVPNQGTTPWTYATNWNYQAEVLNTTNATNITMVMGGGSFGTTESVYTDNTSNAINITAADAASTSVTWANGQNAVSGTPTANSAAVFPVVGASSLRVQMSGTLVGTVVTEASTDGGTTWQAQYIHLTGTSSEASTFTGAASPNTNFEGSTIAAGFTHFRVRCTTFTSGTGTVLVRSTVNPASVEVIAPVFTEPWQNFTTGTTWAAGTTSGTFQTIDSPGSGVQPQAYMVQLDQGSGISAGAITFQVTADGINWATIPASCVIDPTSLLPITLPYTLVASTNRAFKIILYGYTGLRLQVSTTTAGGSVTPYWATVNAASVNSPMGTYNSTAPTLTTGQQVAQQVDTTGSHYINQEGRKQTYRAGIVAYTLLGSSTIPTIYVTGSSTKTVRITKIRFSASAGTGTACDVILRRFSAISGGGAGTGGVTVGKLDTNNAANTATVFATTSAITTATNVYVLATERYEIVTAAVSVDIPLIEWNFGINNDQTLVLRGTSDFIGICVSAVGTTPIGDVWIEWTEE